MSCWHTTFAHGYYENLPRFDQKTKHPGQSIYIHLNPVVFYNMKVEQMEP